MNLSDVYVFKKVANTLSFTKAARQIGVSRSSVSKQVSRLEQDLGVVLINRTTRRVNLTEAGRTFDSNTSDIDTTIEHAASLVRGADMSPLGTVSFSLPTGLGAALMPALTSQFQERWPELRLNVNFDDQVQDMISNNLDLAVIISRQLTDSSLIARRLASTTKVLAASPEYLKRNGMPATPIDLTNHRCLGLGSAVKTGTTWQLRDGANLIEVETKFALSSNNDLTLILAACLGAGIIYVPEICIAGELASNELQAIHYSDTPETYGVYALYPHRNAATKVKVLVDFIEGWLAKKSAADRWDSLSHRINGGKFPAADGRSFGTTTEVA